MIKFDKNKDKIAFIAPASACGDESGNVSLEKSQARLLETIKIYEDSGFSCVYDDAIFTKGNLVFFAAPRDERLRQLKNALLDPEVKIIAAFRGGYGSTEIIFDCLDIKPTTPKTLIGFSDITAMHFLFNQQYKLPTIHGAMGSDHANMIEEVIGVLGGNNMCFNLQTINEPSKLNEPIEGEVVGGNLALLANIIGTPLNPELNGKILFLEDINEKSYQLHRFLVHLKNAGLLMSLKALIFADFDGCDAHFERTIEEFSKQHVPGIPVYKMSGVGHGKINHPIVVGSSGTISDNILNIESPFEIV